ncbi:MAG TPA: 3'-5' exonuclease, partial [Kofleriaceae bacterium]
IVNVPARGLGDTTVDRLRAAARAGAGNLLDAAKLAARGEVAGIGPAPRKKLLAFVELLDGLRDVIAQGASVAETIIQVVDRSGLRAKLEADESSESRDRLDNLAELVTLASDFDEESDEPQTVDGFLERIALSAPADQAASGESVVLMTIHIAKGLEWPVVFLTGMEDGLFPSLREREGVNEDAALEEERRLAYVAITRARHRLVLTHARTRRVWGEIRMQGPSRFLDDIPSVCLAGPTRPKLITPKAPAIVDGNWQGVRRRKPRSSVDELDQRIPDDEPVYRVDDDLEEPTVFRTGDQVTHQLLGVGRVIAMSDGKVIVEFPGAGRKTVLPRFLALAPDDGLN